jgi:16S rRNA (uracil1498-N3)-methyltransferase
MSRPPRFFITPDQVSGPIITISNEDVRHIATVLRMKAGEQLTLCDGQGTAYSVKITEISRTEIKTEVVGHAKQELRKPRVILGQGLPKFDKMDLIVQKATELGVAGIVPLITERTVVKVKDGGSRGARWQKIAREAAMQSNRPDIPQIGQIQSLKDFMVMPAPGFPPPGPVTLHLFPWEEGKEPVRNVLRKNHGIENVVVLIGPEGGFAPQEAELARTRGFHMVSLGPNILRTETAAIAVLSMIGYEFFSE